MEALCLALCGMRWATGTPPPPSYSSARALVQGDCTPRLPGARLAHAPNSGVKTSLHSRPTSILGPRTPHLLLILLRWVNGLIYAQTLKRPPTSSPPSSVLLLGPPKTLLLQSYHENKSSWTNIC